MVSFDKPPDHRAIPQNIECSYDFLGLFSYGVRPELEMSERPVATIHPPQTRIIRPLEFSDN